MNRFEFVKSVKAKHQISTVFIGQTEKGERTWGEALGVWGFEVKLH